MEAPARLVVLGLMDGMNWDVWVGTLEMGIKFSAFPFGTEPSQEQVGGSSKERRKRKRKGTQAREGGRFKSQEDKEPSLTCWRRNIVVKLVYYYW